MNPVHRVFRNFIRILDSHPFHFLLFCSTTVAQLRRKGFSLPGIPTALNRSYLVDQFNFTANLAAVKIFRIKHIILVFDRSKNFSYFIVYNSRDPNNILSLDIYLLNNKLTVFFGM